VSQMPPDVDHYGDPDAEVITRGDYDALHWVDDDSGAEWLFLWAYRQNLVVEACCERAATAELFNIAEASYEGLRIDELARCIGDESDLAREEILGQIFGRAHGCTRLGAARCGSTSSPWASHPRTTTASRACVR
jgi:hypothetical protein